MYQIIDTTYEEKMAMYMVLPKEKLVAMLIECNRQLGERPVTIQTQSLAKGDCEDFQHDHCDCTGQYCGRFQ